MAHQIASALNLCMNIQECEVAKKYLLTAKYQKDLAKSLLEILLNKQENPENGIQEKKLVTIQPKNSQITGRKKSFLSTIQF